MKKYSFMLLISALLLASCGSSEPKPQDTPIVSTIEEVTLSPEQLANSAITIGSPEISIISPLVRLNGKIDVPPQNMVAISFPLGGYLKSTQLLPGMPVKKGEVIATMEDPQYVQLQEEYLAAKNQLIFLEKDFQRQKDLNATKASSDKAFQEITRDYEDKKITVRALGEKLRIIGISPEQLTSETMSRNVNVLSPINGFVSAVNANIGRYLTPTDVLAELVNPSDIHLNLNVFEKDLRELTIGQKVVAFANNHPEKKYNAEIILISQDVQPDGSVEVHCHFSDYDKVLVPGLYMSANVSVSDRTAVLLPESAVVRDRSSYYVFIQEEGGKYIMKPVTPGVTNNGFTEITSGIAPDEKNIVLSNAYTLLMKLRNTSEE